MVTTRLETVEKQVGDNPDCAIVWLHGLGADGNDFVPIVPELGLDQVRYVFPHAPERPVTLNSGLPCRAWFDITTLDHREPEALDRDGLQQSVEQVTALVDAEVARGIAPERIVIAGFSQGGAAALATALLYRSTLAGIIGLSTWAPFAVPDDSANLNTPVMLAHG
ncbi:MAG: alpha/beta fold hydrolase, partial [Gammaproteobacteria bacterium]|nr:alpha/beta fold hydrolase [Gammaproteobacteria bacterium]